MDTDFATNDRIVNEVIRYVVRESLGFKLSLSVLDNHCVNYVLK